jgi:hypothetical protein
MGQVASIFGTINFTFPNLKNCMCCFGGGAVDDDSDIAPRNSVEAETALVMDTLQKDLNILVETNVLLGKKELVSLILFKIMTTLKSASGEVSIIKKDSNVTKTIASINKTAISDFTLYPLKHLGKQIGTISLVSSVDPPDDFINHLGILEDLICELI